MSRPRLIGFLLALVTLLAYLPATHCGFFLFDDEDYIRGNGMVQNGLTWEGIGWAFTTVFAANWHPLTWLSLMADCQFFGLNPGIHHLVNVLIHSANAVLLFFLLRRLTQLVWPSAMVAALFAWHPAHVESVAWIAERKDVLSTCFGLLAMMSYARFAQENSRRHFWLALFWFAFSLMAKPMLVTLPCVLLLLDYWPLERLAAKPFRWSLVWEKAPFFLLSAASSVVTCYAQRPAMNSLEATPLSFRLANAVTAITDYLSALIWPANLAVLYPLGRITIPALMLATVVLLSISAAVWLTRERQRCWLFGWLWFLGTLVPVIGLVQVGGAARADRYTYVPSIGIGIAVVFGLQALAVKFSWPKRLLPAGAIGVLIAYIWLTERQLGYWQDTETNFRHTLAVTGINQIARINLGMVLRQQGRDDEALVEYQKAVSIGPTYLPALTMTGNLLEKMKRPAQALTLYLECVRLAPTNSLYHSLVGRTMAAQGLFDEAYREFVKAETLAPSNALPHLEMAKIYLAHGRGAKAVTELRTAAWNQPDDAETLYNVAHYLATSEDDTVRDGASALSLARRASYLSYDRNSEALDVLSMAYAVTGDYTNAVVSAQQALEFSHNTDVEYLEPIRRRLELYRQHQPWRESFSNTNLPSKN